MKRLHLMLQYTKSILMTLQQSFIIFVLYYVTDAGLAGFVRMVAGVIPDFCKTIWFVV